MAESEQEVLTARLTQYPVDRYPVQHATTQFHLGSVLLQAGETEPALAALTTASEMFRAAGMRLEQAKAAVMLGAGLRLAGRLEEAADTFSAASTALADLDSPLEQAAAAYNLGLVRQDLGDLDAACAAWTRAKELFLAANYPAQSGAAARDHGAALLGAGRAEEALCLLEEALTLAERAGDEAGAGMAANALGLAQLAADDPAAAVTSLHHALGAFPRSIRPAEYAMAKANLALAYEQADDPARARLAARQALGIPSAAAPVRAQAQAVLSRHPGRPEDDLLAVLDVENAEQWPRVIREEVLRVAELSAEHRCALVSGFFDGLLVRTPAMYNLAESLLQVILELPPRTYQQFATAIVQASADRPEPDDQRIRAVLASALARFAIPQWQRLVESLNAAATAEGQPATWR